MPAAEDRSVTERQVRDAQQGDAEALDELFTRYLPRIRRIVASRVGRTVRAMADLDDLVQETVQDALLSIERFEHESDGAFCHWLACCVENNVRDQVRRRRSLKRGEDRVRPFVDLAESSLTDWVFAGNEPTPSEHARGHETEERIERALLSLDERYREVINLRLHCGLSYREVSERMGMRSEKTASVLFVRARSKLRKLLGEDGIGA